MDDTLTRTIALCLAAGELILRDLILPLLALILTVAGWRAGAARSPVNARPVLSPAAADTTRLLPPAAACEPALAGLKVTELRQLARAAGHRSLARSGRRAELLAVLGG